MNNFENYKKALEIDYFVYFAKAYFAFNYYLKHKINNVNNDRLRIDEAKEQSNFSVKFKKLIEKDIFYNNFVDLREVLASNETQNEGKPINFEEVKIQSYREKELCKDTYRGVEYFIKTLNDGKIIIRCGKAEQIKCQFEEVKQQLQKSKKITDFQSQRIIGILEEERGKNIINVNDLINSKSQAINEYEKLYKAFIEIIYNLRNALFHSEIDINNSETKIAYEKAYWLLREFVNTLS